MELIRLPADSVGIIFQKGSMQQLRSKETTKQGWTEKGGEGPEGEKSSRNM